MDPIVGFPWTVKYFYLMVEMEMSIRLHLLHGILAKNAMLCMHATCIHYIAHTIVEIPYVNPPSFNFTSPDTDSSMMLYWAPQTCIFHSCLMWKVFLPEYKSKEVLVSILPCLNHRSEQCRPLRAIFCLANFPRLALPRTSSSQ